MLNRVCILSLSFKLGRDHDKVNERYYSDLQTENEMELSISRWDGVKDQFMRFLRTPGLVRYSTSKVWNREGQFQLLHVFEYRDQEAADACIPIWQQIETKWKEKIENVTSGYRGVLIDQFNFDHHHH